MNPSRAGAWLAVLALLLVPTLSVGALRAEEGPPAVPLERTLEAPPATGLAVRSVVEGSQAHEAGVEPGDVILTYDGVATASPAALQDAIAKATAAAKEKVVLVAARWDGTEVRHELEPGPIGVTVVPVEKGKPASALPPATNVSFDFSSVDLVPRDDWYTFHLGAEGKQGFEHATLVRVGERLVLRREVAFDGGERWGVNHFDVEVVMATDQRLRLVQIRFENPITKYVGEGTATTEGGVRELDYSWRNDSTDASGSHSTALPEDLPAIPSYLVESLASFMPREKGACYHFRPVVDGWGTLEPRAALLCVGPETIDVGGFAVATTRYESRQLGGLTTGTYWVGAAGRVVQADYAGPVARLAAKETALAGLDARIRPRSAD